jgi:hypothetical protein
VKFTIPFGKVFVIPDIGEESMLAVKFGSIETNPNALLCVSVLGFVRLLIVSLYTTELLIGYWIEI